MKDFCVAEATAIFQDPKDLLVRIFLIAKGGIPISDGLKKEWGCMYVLAHIYEKLQGIQFDFVQIILFLPCFSCTIHFSLVFPMSLEADFS